MKERLRAAVARVREEAQRGGVSDGALDELDAAAEAESRARRDAEELTRLSGEHGSEGVFITDLELRIETVNARGAQMLGYEPEQMRGMRIADLIVPEDLAEEPLRRVQILDGKPPTVERRMLHADGSVRVLEVIASRIPGERMLGVARDVTARKLAETRLAQSEASFRTVIEASPDAIAVHVGGKVVYANAALARLLGYASAAEIVGRDVLSAVHPDDVAAVVERIRAMQRGEPWVPFAEERLVRNDGVVVPCEIGAMLVTFQGEPAVVAMIRNLTVRKRMLAQLAQADRLAAVGTLAASVAHEINNPLTYVLLHLDALAARLPQLQVPAAAELAARAQQAADGAQRVRRIVSDLRTFSRGGDEELHVIALEPVLNTALNLAAHELRHRARVEVDVDARALVRGNEGRLCQVFVNLLVNASHALPDSDVTRNVVRVEARVEGARRDGDADCVAVRVTDNGVGMSRTVLAQVFDPFFTTKPAGVGSGLGLSICQDIVSAHGGTLEVDSTEGLGTTFTVRLPVATASSVPASRPSSVAPPRRARVLLVDDEPAIRATLGEALALVHEVECAASVADALALLGARSFDVVLCDVTMPSGSAHDLHAWLEVEHPTLARRMLFMTGGGVLPRDRELLAAAGERVLPKPFPVDLALSRIAKAATGRYDLRALRRSETARPRRRDHAIPRFRRMRASGSSRFGSNGLPVIVSSASR